MKDFKDEPYIQQLKQTLDQSVENIDEDTRYQLQKMRANVLQGKAENPWYHIRLSWKGAVGFVSISLFAAVLLINMPLRFSESLDTNLQAEKNLFEEDNSIELYEEYEFYVWLSEREYNS